MRILTESEMKEYNYILTAPCVVRNKDNEDIDKIAENVLTSIQNKIIDDKRYLRESFGIGSVEIESSEFEDPDIVFNIVLDIDVKEDEAKDIFQRYFRGKFSLNESSIEIAKNMMTAKKQ